MFNPLDGSAIKARGYELEIASANNDPLTL